MRNTLALFIAIFSIYSQAQTASVYEAMARESYAKITDFWVNEYAIVEQSPKIIFDHELRETFNDDSFFDANKLIYLFYFKYDLAKYAPHSLNIFFNESRLNYYLKGYDSALAIDVTLAHEWGHHIQYKFNGWIKDEVTSEEENIVYELSADCLAGFYIGSNDNYTTEQRRALGNYLSVLAGGNHGSPSQRRESFLRGLELESYLECF